MTETKWETAPEKVSMVFLIFPQCKSYSIHNSKRMNTNFQLPACFSCHNQQCSMPAISIHPNPRRAFSVNAARILSEPPNSSTRYVYTAVVCSAASTHHITRISKIMRALALPTPIRHSYIIIELLICIIRVMNNLCNYFQLENRRHGLLAKVGMCEMRDTTWALTLTALLDDFS